MKTRTLTPEAQALKDRSAEMTRALLRAMKPDTLTVAGKEYRLKTATVCVVTVAGGRGKEYHITPCLKATVAGRPDVLVFALVSVSGLRARSVNFGIDPAGKVIEL